MKQKVLLVEDSTSLAVLYKQYVKNEPYDIFHVETGNEAMSFIEKHTPQVVILDLKLPDISGEDVLDWITSQNHPCAVIIATAHGSVNTAVNLMNKGAQDFLEKPITAERLKTSVNVHLKQAKLTTLVEDIQSKFDRKHFQGFIGECLPMQAVYKTIDSVAPTTANVFIRGESGTGKEVCAEAIHNVSLRSDKPFIAINCGAIPRDLMESEIFGHLKGSFTGASSDRKGAAMLADGGTLFLDELCEMELDMQKKLLRFLQTGTFTPLGSSTEQKADIRIICATNRDPLIEVSENRFREDLYYRVHVVPIEMPALRERGSDIITLCRHFLKIYAKQDNRQFVGIENDAESILKHYAWPGNVRQLQNIIRNIVVLHDERKIGIKHLPEIMLTTDDNSPDTLQNRPNLQTNIQDKKPDRSYTPSTVTSKVSSTPDDTLSVTSQSVHKDASTNANAALFNPDGSLRPMWLIEREAIQHAIAFCDGNVINASVMLGLSPSTVYRKKQAWEADNNELKQM